MAACCWAVMAALLTGLGGAQVRAAEAAPFLALPAQAKPLPDTAPGYRLQKVGQNGYVVIAGIFQAVFVVTPAGVVLIDAPPSMVDALKAAIASVTDRPVTYVILSHDHFDHIGGVTRFPGAKIVAHALTAQMLSVFPDPLRPAPTATFPGERSRLTVGGEVFELIYPGPSHEAGEIIVYVPRDKLAVMTDVIVPGWAPYMGWGDADYIPGYFKAFDALLKLDFDTYVGGHLYRTGTRQDVQDARAYMIDLWTWTKQEMAAAPMRPAPEAANVWAAQTIWFDQIADRVTARLTAKWQDRLAAVDTFTHDTVIDAMVSIITDNPNIPPELLR
jgi:glyoxylase-like metal-dependent hydrolase (beta-lactamase superfamily II)